MFEMTTLFFSVIRDLAVSIMRLDITSGVSSNERSFVPTCIMYRSGLKSLLVGWCSLPYGSFLQMRKVLLLQ